MDKVILESSSISVGVNGFMSLFLCHSTIAKTEEEGSLKDADTREIYKIKKSGRFEPLLLSEPTAFKH